MNDFALIYPMFAMTLLTAVVLGVMFRTRVSSVASGQVSAGFFKLYRGEEEPEASVLLSRHFRNLFEAPTLFYVVCLAAMITAQSSLALQLLAWAYVLLRVGHAYIHIVRNKLRQRINIYFASWIVLFSMWVLVTVGVFTAS